MRWWWLALAIGCGDKGDGGDTVEGDADTDADTDSDTDTDSTEPQALTCLDAACDGDPTGVWNLLGECLEHPALVQLAADCPAAEIAYFPAGLDGTANFSATDYLFQAAGGSTTVSYTIPEACNATGCLNFQIDELGVQCTTDGAGGCSCNGNFPSTNWVDQGTWTRAGGALSLSSSSSGGSKTLDVCVSGDWLWLHDPVRDASVVGRRAE